MAHLIYAKALFEFKRKYWLELLTEVEGDVTTAWKLSGLASRTTLYRTLEKMQIPWKRASVHYGKKGNWGDLTD